MGDYWGDAETMVQRGVIKLPYTWQAGETASYYLTQLRDEKKLWGKRCPKCTKVLAPPRMNCPFCSVLTDAWVELTGEGTVDTFTVVHRSTDIHPMKPPFAYAIIRLDGADTGFLHVLGDVDVKEIEEGMRVKAVFSEERVGLPTDISYFRPMA